MNDDFESLAAVRPCGCLAMIMTVSRPAKAGFSAYRAEPRDFADFYAAVARYTTRKRKPLQLEVKTLRGKPDWRFSCDACCKPKALFDGKKKETA